jgi:hypothetical protein
MLDKTSRIFGSQNFVAHHRALSMIVIVAVGLIITLPVLLYGFPFYSDDGAIHAVWYTQFSEQFWSGDLYPRWLQGLNGGLGSPAFFYYPPVPYYLTSLLKPLFTQDPLGWRQLGVSASVAMIASGITLFLWLERFVGQRSALIGALLYMAMPYHAAIDLYVRGAFAELWAFVWVPLILSEVQHVRDRRRFAIARLALCYALLVMSHLPTTLIFSPLVICDAFFMTEAPERKRTLALTLGAMALGTGLAAIYLLPAMMMQDFVFMQAMLTDNFNYENWFLLTKWLSVHLTAKLSWIVLTTIFLASGAYWLSRTSSDAKIKRAALFWTTTAAICFFMMTPVSKPLWKLIVVLQRVQFPWRFNIILLLATTVLLSLSLHAIKRPFTPKLYVIGALALLLITSWIPLTFWAAWRNVPLSDPQKEEKLEDVSNRLRQRKDVDEYRPIWAALQSRNVNPFIKELIQPGRNQSHVELIEGMGRVSVERWEPGFILLKEESTGGMVLDVDQFYYPGWAAYMDESQPIALEPSSDKGLLRISIPGGRHLVRLSLERKRPEQLGRALSAISLALFLVLIIWSIISRPAPVRS